MIRQQSCRVGFSLRACGDLVHTGQAYSAAKYHRARQLGLSVDALHPHFQFASSRMILFVAFTYIFVFSMCFYSTEFGHGGRRATICIIGLRFCLGIARVLDHSLGYAHKLSSTSQAYLPMR